MARKKKRESKITPAQLTRFLRDYMNQHPFTYHVEAHNIGGLIEVRAQVFNTKSRHEASIACVDTKKVLLHKDKIDYEAMRHACCPPATGAP
jgi:hypothetical protein